MGSSTRLLLILKIVAVAGIFLNLVGVGVIVLVMLFKAGVASKDLWIAMWGTFCVGLPGFGILYGTLKVREYLRDLYFLMEKKPGS